MVAGAQASLRRAFATWLRQVLLPARLPGLQQGLRQGEAEVLLRLLRRRFGELLPEVVERVRQCDSERLLVWSERVLDAESLMAVFGDQAN
ncbi:MAG: DUF4351 domain-containing protein [Candidatus Contendobacter sp.]|nr:DUF4351 domain-containing protein [Candidatus Contendobacter sp.]MDG4556945.1 DUF4351 domain-containing protein [Candidatus Contendobacter sp.]